MEIKTWVVWSIRVQVSRGVMETERNGLGEGLSKMKYAQRSYLEIYNVAIQVKIIIKEDSRMHEL